MLLKKNHYFNLDFNHSKNIDNYFNLSRKPFLSGMSADDAVRYDDYWRNLGICSEKTWSEYLSHNNNGNIDEYFEIIQKQSPWPPDFIPQESMLTAGDKINIVLDSNQPITKPGRFATIDEITCVDEVRNNLAVKVDWKTDPRVVVSYSVKDGVEIPTLNGPVGPQIDLKANCYYPGGYNQLNLLLDYDIDMMNYLNIESFKIID